MFVCLQLLPREQWVPAIVLDALVEVKLEDDEDDDDMITGASPVPTAPVASGPLRPTGC